MDKEKKIKIDNDNKSDDTTNNKSYTNNILKVVALCLTFAIVGIAYTFYSNWQYKTSLSSLYDQFNTHNYEQAYSIYSNDLSHIPFKSENLKTDLSTYFTKVISVVCDNLDANKISDKQALEIINEVNKYNLFGDSLQKLAYSIQGQDVKFFGDNDTLFKKANEAYANNNYTDAIGYLNKISSDYSKATEVAALTQKCKDDYKTNLLAESDGLAANKYYSKAIDLLNKADTNIVSSTDEDIQNKLKFYAMIKEEYIQYQNQEDAAYTSTAILQAITEQNVNTLDIDSKTPYIVYVNLTDQKTYVYEGEKNNWKLVKTFPCSTGLPGKETPKGVFDVDERGEWFYSEQFAQGGKYFVQFLGDYLFHSLPYDKSGTKVVDETLGVPMSHGCIRLKDNDAKWLYDNIGRNTKVIIN